MLDIPRPVPLRALLDRREVLGGGLAGFASMLLRPIPRRSAGLLGFAPIAASCADEVRVPPGYTADPFALWGDPIGHRSGAPAFKIDASNGADDQALQFGMHHDGMHFFPLGEGRGVLCVNHEYFDRGLLHPARPPFAFTAEQIQKEMNAVGVTVCEVARTGGRWRVVPNSRLARRITADTRVEIRGPAAGDPLLRTAFDDTGSSARGTLGNCAAGQTPWHTFLTCEENFPDFFVHRGPIPDELRAYGFDGKGVYGWAKGGAESANCERFDAHRHPNEPNRFGWVVEIDPFDPDRPPVKRTALGRFKHENAAVTLAAGTRGPVVVYMGDDEPNQHVYKFVSSQPYEPDGDPQAQRDLLDEGTLHVARFDDDGTGEWIPLTTDRPELADMSPARILVETRIASRRVGATPMDRPEWIAIDPLDRRVYCALTNNGSRADAPHGANPRATNPHGHIVWWDEQGDPTSRRFRWGVFVLAGDPLSANPDAVGNNAGDLFSAPDGLAFDPRGVLWIQTDVSSSKAWHPLHANGRGEFAAFRNNQMLAVDRTAGTGGVPDRGSIRRFLTGPVGCEITGFTMLPDQRTLFVNVQHPGEPLSDKASESDPSDPTRYSSWPHGTRPRSGIVAITKDDGGVIGT